MKIKAVVVMFIGLAAIGGVRSPMRAEHMATSRQAPAKSSPESQSVWDGIYTEEQAMRRGPLYSQNCARCHGSELTGGETAPALASPEFKGNWSGLSLDDLFERI